VVIHRTDGTGSPRHLHHEGQRVEDLAFTPDGAALLAAGHEGSLHLHPLTGDRPAATLALGTSPLVRLAVSPDGRRAAAASLDGRLSLIALDPLRLVVTIRQLAPVFALAFGPSGDALVAADAEGEVLLIDAGSGAVRARRSIGSAAFALALRGDGRLAVAGESGVVYLLGPGLEPRGALGSPGAAITALAFDPASGRLAAAAVDGSLQLYPASGVDGARRLPAYRDPFGLAWAPQGGDLLTFGWDGRALLWSGPGEPVAMPLEGPSVVSAAFAPAGGRIVTRADEGTLRVWPLVESNAATLLAGHTKPVDTVTWSRDGGRLLTAGHDGSARAWDRASGRLLLKLVDPAGIFHSAAWDAGERRLLTSSEDGVARVWDASTGKLLLNLPQAGAPVLFAAWSPDGLQIATAGLDGLIRLHRADGTGPVRRFKGHDAGVTHVTFSPDGTQLVSASQLDVTIRIWPLDGAPARVLRADRPVFRAGLSPRGDLLAVAEIDGPVRLFRVADLTELPPLPAWPERLRSLAWSPDQRRLALSSFDGTVRVVGLDGAGASDGGEPLLLRGSQGAVSEVAFSPDGRELAIASGEGTVRITAIDWPLLRTRLATATSACLTTAQRLHLLGETEEESTDRFADCEARHGRSPAPPAAPRVRP
jgi:WD40 repeat protein